MLPAPADAVAALGQDPGLRVQQAAGDPGVVGPGGEPGRDPFLVVPGSKDALSAGQAVADKFDFVCPGMQRLQFPVQAEGSEQHSGFRGIRHALGFLYQGDQAGFVRFHAQDQGIKTASGLHGEAGDGAAIGQHHHPHNGGKSRCFQFSPAGSAFELEFHAGTGPVQRQGRLLPVQAAQNTQVRLCGGNGNGDSHWLILLDCLSVQQRQPDQAGCLKKAG